MDYLFAYAVKKARKEGFASLADHERWDWHGDVYGFRRVVLGVEADVKTSPCDPEGQWFDANRAKLAEDHYRAALQGGAARRRRTHDDSVFEARDIENKWARDRGYNDFEHYKEVERLDHADACANVIKSFIASMPQMPGRYDRQTADRDAVLRELGVTAREYDPEELRKGRIALGLEQSAEPAAGAA